MLDSVWRVMELDFNALKFIEDYKIENVNTVFIQGEESRPGKINEKSGFNVSISSNESSKDHIDNIQKFINTNERALSYLLKNDFRSSIDIGCSLDLNSFTKSVTINPNLLGLLNKYNIDLVFSTYPMSNE